MYILHYSYIYIIHRYVVAAVTQIEEWSRKQSNESGEDAACEQSDGDDRA